MSPYFFPEFPIIDAHAHLWDHLHGNVNGYPVESLGNGQSTFNGSVRLMMPLTCLMDEIMRKCFWLIWITRG